MRDKKEVLLRFRLGGQWIHKGTNNAKKKVSGYGFQKIWALPIIEIGASPTF